MKPLSSRSEQDTTSENAYQITMDTQIKVSCLNVQLKWNDIVLSVTQSSAVPCSSQKLLVEEEVIKEPTDREMEQGLPPAKPTHANADTNTSPLHLLPPTRFHTYRITVINPFHLMLQGPISRTRVFFSTSGRRKIISLSIPSKSPNIHVPNQNTWECEHR